MTTQSLAEKARAEAEWDKLSLTDKIARGRANEAAAGRGPKRTLPPRPSDDGLDFYRERGGDQRWGKNLSAADAPTLNVVEVGWRERALKRGEPWPPAVSLSRAELNARAARGE